MIAGLPGEKPRLDSALVASDYYHLRNKRYIQRRDGEGDADFANRPKRIVPFARVLSIEHVTAGYGGTTVLRNVTLTVPERSVVALLGAFAAAGPVSRAPRTIGTFKYP